MLTRPVFVRLLLALSAFAAALVPAATAAAATKPYVVVLKAKPLASYEGGVQGRPATSPQATGARKVDTGSAAAREYRSYLDGRQRAAIGRAPGTVTPTNRYRTALAGFSARLSPSQRAALRKAPEVAAVLPDRIEHALADAPTTPSGVLARLGLSGGGAPFDTPGYLGLPAGIWGAGGPDQAGDGLVVGVIDTGINPEHPSFSDDPDGANASSAADDNYLGTPYAAPPAGWNAEDCDPGEDPSYTFECNGKLIGAKYFDEAFAAGGGFSDDESVSPLDTEGHGSHTASSAAGNYGVNPKVGNNDLGVDLISGIAPHAYIAAYKALWTGPDGSNGGYSSDLAAAIDQAVADGVDVINYSIGSSGSSVIGADSLAFLGASDANVFVSVSAGNDGPDASTVSDPAGAPWVTSAAASTGARTFKATVTTTAPAQTITGASAGVGLATATPIVVASTAAKAGSTAAEAQLCLDGSLDPAKVTGKVVLCKRGGPSRIATSYEVQQAGGVGEVLYNGTQGQDLAAYPFFLPTVAIDAAEGTALAAAITPSTKVTLGKGTAGAHAARVLAAFSSRGPTAATPDVSKPDVAAPGVDILGANTPYTIPGITPQGLDYQVISGTSMAAPQVAGAGALLKQAHPSWTPAEVKSALVTTARSGVKTEDGTTAATPFDTGGGELDANVATKAPLVLDEGTDDYLAYINTEDPENGAALGLDGLPPVPSRDLNLPSIAVEKVVSSVTVSRTVTSTVAGARGYTVAAAVPGFAVTLGGEAEGGQLVVRGGGSATLDVTAKRTTAPFDAYAVGALTLTPTSGSAPVVRIPISLRPVELDVPDTAQVTTDQAAGTAPLQVTAGFTGALSGTGFGLAKGDEHPGETISTDATVVTDAPNAGNRFYDVTVPEGGQLLAGAITGTAPAESDLDLYLFYDANGDGSFDDTDPAELYATSATGAANEAITEVAPEPGNYRFVVNGYGTGNPSTYDFTTWSLADTSPDVTGAEPSIAITGDPYATTSGEPLAPTLEYAGLTTAGTYLGVVTYGRTAGLPFGDEAELGSTIVRVTKTGDAAPPTGEPTPPPAPPVTPPAPGPAPGAGPVTPKLTLGAVSRAGKTRFRLLCESGCQVTAKLTIDAKTARRIKRRAGRTLAVSRRVAAPSAKTREWAISVSRKLRRSLRASGVKRLKVKLSVRLTSTADGKTVVSRGSTTLRLRL